MAAVRQAPPRWWLTPSRLECARAVRGGLEVELTRNAPDSAKLLAPVAVVHLEARVRRPVAPCRAWECLGTSFHSRGPHAELYPLEGIIIVPSSLSPPNLFSFRLTQEGSAILGSVRLAEGRTTRPRARRPARTVRSVVVAATRTTRTRRDGAVAAVLWRPPPRRGSGSRPAPAKEDVQEAIPDVDMVARAYASLSTSRPLPG